MTPYLYFVRSPVWLSEQAISTFLTIEECYDILYVYYIYKIYKISIPIEMIKVWLLSIILFGLGTCFFIMLMLGLMEESKELSR